MTYERYSYRLYGEPKLQTPKELKEVKSFGSADFVVGKCRCRLFIHEGDLWIKHRDFFSSSFVPREKNNFGLPQNELLKKYFPNMKLRPEKFCYCDNWSSIVLRNEAWIVFHGFETDDAWNNTSANKNWIEHLVRRRMIEAFQKGENLQPFGVWEPEWERYFERVIEAYSRIKV